MGVDHVGDFTTFQSISYLNQHAQITGLPDLAGIVFLLLSAPGIRRNQVVRRPPLEMTAQLSYLGDIGSAGSIAVERRRKSSTSKFRQSGIRIGAQQVSLYFYDEVKGFGLCGGAYFLAGQTHCLDLHAGGSMIYDTSPRRTTFSSFLGTNGRSPNSGHVGLTLLTLLYAGYRYVSPGPAGLIFKVGIGTLGLYAGFGFNL